MISKYIFRPNLVKDYIQDFNRYVVNIVYGNDVILGSDIENEWKDDD